MPGPDGHARRGDGPGRGDQRQLHPPQVARVHPEPEQAGEVFGDPHGECAQVAGVDSNSYLDGVLNAWMYLNLLICAM